MGEFIAFVVGLILTIAGGIVAYLGYTGESQPQFIGGIIALTVGLLILFGCILIVFDLDPWD